MNYSKGLYQFPSMKCEVMNCYVYVHLVLYIYTEHCELLLQVSAWHRIAWQTVTTIVEEDLAFTDYEKKAILATCMSLVCLFFK